MSNFPHPSRKCENCQAFSPILRKDGYIMGHDYFANPAMWGTSVIRAVNERIQTGDIKMEAIFQEMQEDKWQHDRSVQKPMVLQYQTLVEQ